MQMGHTPTSTYDNQPVTGTKKESREGQSSRHINTTRKKTNTRIPITFKVNVPEVGTVLITKENNYKESFQNLQDNILQ